MQPLIFDTHAHYFSRAFRHNRDQLMAELPKKGVALVLECGTDYKTTQKSIELAEKYSYVYAAAGIHPESLIEEDASTRQRFGGDWRAEIEALKPLYSHPKVVAVGEVGLDHHWPVPKDAQLEMFEAFIRLALELDMPLSMHDREAHAETYALLKKYKPKGVLHAFSGSVEDMRWLVAQGIHIGLGGPVTYKNGRRPQEVAAAVPLDHLLLETDCPYMTPEPFRGKKNNSALISYTAEKIAELRGLPVETVLTATLENGKRLFGITS